MARPREFDMTEVLDAAMETFWRQGYDGTSMADLLRSTGLHKGSLYKAFRDKRSLYMAAIERYIGFVYEGWRQTVASTDSPRAALQAWFHGLVTYQGALKGCLVANASAEVAHRDPEIAQMLRTFTETMRAKFSQKITDGQQAGEFRASANADLVAEALVIAMFGIRVVGKHSPRSLGLVDVLLASLE